MDGSAGHESNLGHGSSRWTQVLVSHGNELCVGAALTLDHRQQQLGTLDKIFDIVTRVVLELNVPGILLGLHQVDQVQAGTGNDGRSKLEEGVLEGGQLGKVVGNQETVLVDLTALAISQKEWVWCDDSDVEVQCGQHGSLHGQELCPCERIGAQSLKIIQRREVHLLVLASNDQGSDTDQLESGL